MSLVSRIRERVSAFDRRSPSILGETEAEFGKDPGYVDAVIDLVADPDPAVSSGATWLIKSSFEGGASLSVDQTGRFLDQITQVKVWDAQLHICQSVRYLDIKATDAQLLVEWVQPLLTDGRPFLRAWSMDGLCRLALLHSAYMETARSALMKGSEDNAASVRARARRLEKQIEGL